MGSVCGTALGDDEVVGVVEVVAAGVDSLEGILGSLWVATVGVLCTGRQGWVGLALALVQTGTLVHVLVAQLLRLPLIVGSGSTSVLCHQVLSSECHNDAVFLLTNWLFVLLDMCATLFQWEVRTFWREKEGL